MGDQSGKRFLITGGTSGLGLAAATALTEKGGEVTITARDPKKGARAQDESGAAHLIELDLADLSSVRDCASKITTPFDVVILNAGVMAIPYRLTRDGFEMQLGTNHLGHFAFAGLIKDQIKDRLISVSSQAHRLGTFGDHSKEEIRSRALGKGKYSPWAAYGDSKLANLLFVNEIERRRIREALESIIASSRSDEVIVYQIPLLVESKGADRFDAIITVSAPIELRRERAIARGMKAYDFENRLVHQATDAEREAIADYVIDNSGNRDELLSKIEELWESHLRPEARANS